MLKIETLKEYWINAFPGETKKSADFFFENYFDPHDYYELIEDDVVVSLAMKVHWIDIMIDGKSHNVPFLIGMYTVPKYRKMGKMRQLLDMLIDIARLRGAPMVMLQAYDYSVYKRQFTNYWTFTEFQIGDYKVEPIKRQLMTPTPEGMKNVYDKFVKKLNLYKSRTLHDFELIIKKAEIYGDKILMLEDAYLIVNDKHNEITESVFIDPSQMQTLISMTTVDKIYLTELQYYNLASQLDLKKLGLRKVMAAYILKPDVLIPEIFMRGNVWISEEL